MKKHVFGLLALVVAISAAAFATVTKSTIPSTSKLFRYTAPGDSFEKSNVENRANWLYITETEDCQGPAAKACEMLVPITHVNENNNTLKSSLTITAAESSPGVAYVQSATGSSITNRSN